MGADYDDSLRQSSTTHLICRDASGSKYEKATEWKIQTISIDWLYHVAAFGYYGGSSVKQPTGGSPREGCEAQFSISNQQLKA